MYSIDEARKLLEAAGVFYGSPDEPEDEEDILFAQTLNMNDTWAWACADSEYVPDDELVTVATLFYRYGKCGLLYWVSQRRNDCQSAFHDNNRFIDFVRQEEAIRAEVPSSSTRAYEKRQYSIGG